MKNFRGLLIPLLLVGFLANSFPLLAQQEAFSFTVEEGEIDWFVDHILCEFDITISESSVTTFLEAFLSNTSTNPCDMISPQYFGSTHSSETYKWSPSSQAINYSLASLGLGNGSMTQNQTTNDFFTFDNLTPQLYLFVFLANCLDGSSIANILIVDKDVYFQDEGYENFAVCGCRGRGLSLLPNAPCPLFNAVTFPWNNNSDINKYRYNISGGIGETPYEAEFWVLFNQTTVIPEINILGCSDYFISGEPNAIGDGENFQVMFSTSGIHIYLLNESLSSSNVTGVRCDGFSVGDSRLLPKKALTDAETIITDFEVVPNPFSNQLAIKNLTQYEGEVTLSLLAVDGSRLSYEKRMTHYGEESITMEVDHIPAGLYTLVYEINGNRFLEKVIKQ